MWGWIFLNTVMTSNGPLVKLYTYQTVVELSGILLKKCEFLSSPQILVQKDLVGKMIFEICCKIIPIIQDMTTRLSCPQISTARFPRPRRSPSSSLLPYLHTINPPA